VAFWPWTAFSEAVVRASGAITGNAALIGKVAFASELLPLSSVAATFLMHSAGYLAVLLVLQLTGTAVHWWLLPLALGVLLALWVLASALALIASAMQVFMRDVAQILPPLMTFWFFTTPIVYSADRFPARLSWIMDWNVMAWFVGQLRDLLLGGNWQFSPAALGVPALSLALFWLALRFFRRLSGHFEDFI
jgi:ABC-type polysaccharide/polyol phosphate export permease